MPAELYPPPPWRFDTPEARLALQRWWLRDPLVAIAKDVLPHHALRLLPTDAVSAIGARLAWDQERRRPVASDRARAALRLMRPGAGAQEIDGLLRAHWRHLGRCLAEISALHRIWREGRVEVAGEDHLRAVLASGRPLVVAGMHVGHWEVLHAGLAGLGLRFAAIYQRLPSRFQMGIVNAARRRSWPGVRPPVLIDPTPRALHAARRALAGPDRAMLYYVDENWGGRVQAPSLGRPITGAGNIALAVRLAGVTGAAILPCYALRLGEAARFRLTFLPEIAAEDPEPGEPGGRTAIASLDAAIETVVRAHPEQWLMLHAFRADR